MQGTSTMDGTPIDTGTLAGLAATATAVVAFLALLYRIPWVLGA